MRGCIIRYFPPAAEPWRRLVRERAVAGGAVRLEADRRPGHLQRSGVNPRTVRGGCSVTVILVRPLFTLHG
jgi:hypothetical protein